MLFSKLKHKDEELLPPPPPFPNLEFEEQAEEKPKFFDEIIKPKKAETFPEEKEFSELVKKVEELKPKKMLSKREKTIAKKRFKKITQQKKIKVKKAQPIKIIQVKPIKEKKITLKKPSIKQAKKPLPKIKQKLPIKKTKTPKIELPELKENFLKDIDFGLPKKLEKSKEGTGFPETLEDFDIEGEYKQKPKEILEAEEEIKSAIENIKKQENKSILKRLFSKKLKEEAPEERLMLELPAVDNLSKIQNKINEARQALMKFDLKTAKRNYIEAMRLYNNISPEDKAKVYHDIKELYFERKSAEELKV